MRLIKKTGAAILLAAMPMLLHAQTTDREQSITVEWYELSGTTAAGEQRMSVMTGSFVGVHNDALIVAGGVNSPIAQGDPPGDEQTGATYYDTIWVATRDLGSDQDGDSDIEPNERPLTWHRAHLTLAGNRAYGASASHDTLGLIAVGGTDGNAGHSNAVLIRWDEFEQQLSLLALPDMPSVTVAGGAAIIDDILYVMAGDNGRGASADFYSFDLSRIELDDAGNPIPEGNKVRIIDNQDGRGSAASAWRKLPSLPQLEGENLGRTHMMVVTQNDGRGDRIYIAGGANSIQEFNDLWAYSPGSSVAMGTWTRLADVIVSGQTPDLSGAEGIALGQTHILLLTDATGKTDRKALSFNTITNAWTEYDEASPAVDAEDGVGSELSTLNAAVKWGDDLVLTYGEVGAGYHLLAIWAIKVKGPTRNFGWQNMAVLIVYLLSMLMIGVYFAFKNEGIDDYFRAGQGIPWWAAACSIYATMLSSLTYVALPALVYRTDWLTLVGSMTVVIVAPFVIRIVLPFFRQIDATSAYEYLSKRFNMPARLFASGLFTLFHISRMGIVLALTALALAAVTPLDTWQSVLVMGVLSVMYCTLGGIEAVIWTDTVQTVVLLIGAVVCVVYILIGVDGGLFGIIDSGMQSNKFKMVSLDFGPQSITTLSIWVIVLGGIGQYFSGLTADQAVVQRYMTTKSCADAAKSIWANAILTVPSSVLFFFIGTGLYVFYAHQPEKLDPTLQIDQIFPAFIASELPIGIAGLIVAGIFSAAQSTISTSMNSIATTLVTDFMRPFDVCKSENGYLNAARMLTFFVGILGTLAGLLFISPEIRSLMEEYFKIVGMFMGALAGLFVLGFMTTRANGWGALTGLFVGVGVMFVVWRLQLADGYLFATIGTLSCLGAGYLASLLFPTDDHDLDGLTIYSMRSAESN